MSNFIEMPTKAQAKSYKKPKGKTQPNNPKLTHALQTDQRPQAQHPTHQKQHQANKTMNTTQTSQESQLMTAQKTRQFTNNSPFRTTATRNSLQQRCQNWKINQSLHSSFSIYSMQKSHKSRSHKNSPNNIDFIKKKKKYRTK